MLERRLFHAQRTQHWYTVDIINRLLGHYNGEAAFLGDLAGLQERYRGLLCALVEHPLSRDPGQIEHTHFDLLREADHPELRALVTAIESFATSNGLRAPWGGEVVYRALERSAGDDCGLPSFPKVESLWVLPEPCKIRIDGVWHPEDEPYERAEERWRKDARQQVEPYRESVGNSFEHRPALDRHVTWLYERIALQHSWSEIAKTHTESIRTVTWAVKTTSARLCLSLPEVRRGRPTKNSR